MHDTLDYFQHDPIHRSYHHDSLTFGLLYAFTENFVLPLSHDEVVHGKGSLLSKMPGDRWQQLANLRALYAYMWAHPGQEAAVHGRRDRPGAGVERTSASLDWHLLEHAGHAGVQRLVARPEPALPGRAGALGARLRAVGLPLARGGRRRPRTCSPSRASSADGSRVLVCVCNFADAHRDRATGSAFPRGGALARDPEHGLEPLRRLERRPERGRSPPTSCRGTASRSPPSSRCRRSSVRLARPGGPISVWPGSPFPLGATWHGEGTNFSLFSEHAEGVELCLFDEDGLERRHELTQRTGHDWHGYLPGRRPGPALRLPRPRPLRARCTVTGSTRRSC